MHIRVPLLPSWRGEPRRGKLRRGQRRWITAVAVSGLTATSALAAAGAYIIYSGPGALERIASRLVPPSSGDESYQTEQPTPRRVAATIAAPAPAPEVAVATAAEPDVPEIGVPQAEITALQAEVPRVDGPPPSALLVASLGPTVPADPAAGPSATPGQGAAAAPATSAPGSIGPAMFGPQVGGGEFVRSGGGGEVAFGSSPPMPGFAALPTGGLPISSSTPVSTPAPVTTTTAPQSMAVPVTPPSTPAAAPVVQQPAPAPVVQQAAPSPVVLPPQPSAQPVVNNPGPAVTPTSTSPAPATSSPVVSGPAPGTTPSNPILPREQVAGSFVLPLESCLSGCTGQDWRYFDPPVAVGFRYEMNAASANGIAKIKLPNFGDGEYDLFLFDIGLGKWTDTGVDIHEGDEFDLIGAVTTLTAPQRAAYGIDVANVVAHGLYAFEILGIEPDANIDPEHPHNFISGLLFAGPVSGDLILTPLTIDTDLQNQDPTNPTAGRAVAVDVPEPSSLALMLIGAIGLRAARGRFRRR